MKKAILYFLLLFLVPVLLANEESLTFGPFGKITLYHESTQTGSVALFVSGDGGGIWVWWLWLVNLHHLTRWWSGLISTIF